MTRSPQMSGISHTEGMHTIQCPLNGYLVDKEARILFCYRDATICTDGEDREELTVAIRAPVAVLRTNCNLHETSEISRTTPCTDNSSWQ